MKCPNCKQECVERETMSGNRSIWECVNNRCAIHGPIAYAHEPFQWEYAA